MTPQEYRLKCRSGELCGCTSGACEGYAQANLIVLPSKLAQDFENLCYRNPVPCPLLAKTVSRHEVSNKAIIGSSDFDITTDLPLYKVYRDGKFITEKYDISDEWTADHTGFLIGCSFSFESDLVNNGYSVRHQQENCTVPMYMTTKLLDPAGVFVGCPYVVSMRPYKPSEIPEVRRISGAFRLTHGEPIDWGYDGAKRLGIADLAAPDFGDAVTIAEDEVPVFWACGVTPQVAIESIGERAAGVVMSHGPGRMLILDITDNGIKGV